MADADAIALGLWCFAATAICGFFGAVAFATTPAPAPAALAKRGEALTTESAAGLKTACWASQNGSPG